jgi:acetamidase/formamidase
MSAFQLRSSPRTCHYGCFSAAIEPVLTVESGDRVTIETVSGGLGDLPETGFTLLPEHRPICAALSPDPGPHILTGPIAIAGAAPGDVLEIRIEDIALRQDWGWTAIRRGRGTLPEDFPADRLRHSRIDIARRTATLPWGAEIALKPFFGVMGVAPRPERGKISSIEPFEHGGNIDLKELVAGTILFLPVWTEGALFSVGDGHAVQGDGEVCLTALETALTGRLQLILHKDRSLDLPIAQTPDRLITMGFDPDLDIAARIALRQMIAQIRARTALSAEDAYMLCSLAADLRVTQLVDGNKGIHAMLDRSWAP